MSPQPWPPADSNIPCYTCQHAHVGVCLFIVIPFFVRDSAPLRMGGILDGEGVKWYGWQMEVMLFAYPRVAEIEQIK